MSDQISLSRFNILVVDDNAICLNIVSSMLRRWNYEVVTINCPLNALAITRVRDIDLVLTDLHMPKMNGIQLQKQIEAEAKLPVIIMSADDNKKIILESLSSGAAFFLSKPVNLVDLKNLWQHIVASKRDKSMRCIEKIGGMQAVGSSAIRKTSSNGDTNIASSMNKGKHTKNQKNCKRKSPPKKLENIEEENSVAPKKRKVIWDTTLHNRFLQAIRHLTLEKAVPKNILELMNVPGLTRANVASHLQKYRIFLKKVAEKNFDASSKNSQEAYVHFKGVLPFPYFDPINFGSIGGLLCSNSGLASFSSLSPFGGFGQSRLGGSSSTQANAHKPFLANTHPLFQSNHTNDCGVERNDIGTNMLFGSGDIPMSGTSSMQMIPNDHCNNMSASLFGTFRVWSPNYGAPSNNNMKTIEIRNVSFSDPNFNLNYFNSKNFVGIHMDDDGNQIAVDGQLKLNSADGLNGRADSNLINGAQTLDLGVGAAGDSTFSTCLAAAVKSSFAGFNGNYQSPTSLPGVNFEQGSTSALPSMGQQQFDLENIELNDFMSRPQQSAEFTNMLMMKSTNFQSPHHQQQGPEGFENPNFASNSAFPSETNPPASQTMDDLDCRSPVNAVENQPWDEPSLEQILEIEELLSFNLEDIIANSSDNYHLMLEKNP